jgi:hypothetical protein
MTKIFIILIATFFAFACTMTEKENKLSITENTKREADWSTAVPIASQNQIVGNWAGEAKDMPNGSRLVEWKRQFEKDGKLTESISTSKEATGPILYYSIKNARLYVSDSPDTAPKEQGELRLQNDTLLMKGNNGIYVFHRQK